MVAQDQTQPYVKRRKRKIVAWFFFGVGGTGCLALGILAFLGQVSGNFSISLKESDQTKLAMATESNFSDESSYLRAQGLTSADVIAADILPDDSEIDSDVGGSKNGPNYLAYTFYIKNTTTEKVSYNVSVNIDNYKSPSNQAVSLIAILRMRVYENAMVGDTLTHSMLSGNTFYLNEAPITEHLKTHFLKVENLIAYDTSSAGVALACQLSKTSLLTIKAVSYQVGRDEQKLNYLRKGLEVMPMIGKIITKFLIEKESE